MPLAYYLSLIETMPSDFHVICEHFKIHEDPHVSPTIKMQTNAHFQTKSILTFRKTQTTVQVCSYNILHA